MNAENQESIRFQILDLNGKVINYQDKPVVSGVNQIEFNVSQLVNGTYLIKNVTARFVKLTITGTLNPSVTATSIREFSIYGE